MVSSVTCLSFLQICLTELLCEPSSRLTSRRDARQEVEQACPPAFRHLYQTRCGMSATPRASWTTANGTNGRSIDLVRYVYTGHMVSNVAGTVAVLAHMSWGVAGDARRHGRRSPLRYRAAGPTCQRPRSSQRRDRAYIAQQFGS